jgi:hypothetical protein
MPLRIAVLALACVFGPIALATAHPGHDHKLMGTITAIAGDRVTIKTTEGQERSFEITSETKLLRGKKKGITTDLKVGMRVVVNVGSGQEPLRAKQVQYAGNQS